MPDQATIEDFKEDFKVSLHGELIQPSNEGYDDARKVYSRGEACLARRKQVIRR